MKISKIKNKLPEKVYEVLTKEKLENFLPGQEKAIKQGVFKNKNLLVCAPTASGKTLIAELALMKNILEKKGKGVYIVPLKALATEKYNDFKKRYGSLIKIALSVGDVDSAEKYLLDYDLIICTSEKLDSLIRHHSPWIRYLNTIIIDEIHLLNDPSRGPTLEILITLLKKMLPQSQLIGLSATIGNPEELAKWLEAELVLDDYRPVELKKGICFENKIEFYELKR